MDNFRKNKSKSRLTEWISNNQDVASLMCATIVALLYALVAYPTVSIQHGCPLQSSKRHRTTVCSEAMQCCNTTISHPLGQGDTQTAHKKVLLAHLIFSTLVLGFASFLATKGIIIVYVYGNKLDKLYETNIQKIEDELNRAVEIMSIDSEDKSFENKLQLLRSKEGGIKWIISKFISKQLCLNFNELSFRVGSKMYSKFSQKLYHEVEDSLLLTNSVNLYVWVKALIPRLDGHDIIPELSAIANEKAFETWWEDRKNNVPDFEERCTPDHIKAWKGVARNIKRKRLVILHQSDIENFGAYEPFYLFFKAICGIKDDDEDTRFTTCEDLARITTVSLGLDFYDYAIFDNKIALELEIGSDKEESKEHRVSLIDLSDKKSQELMQSINDIDEQWKQFYSIKSIEKCIVKTKQRYYKNLLLSIDDDSNDDNSNAAFHSYCYHAYGGDCWKNVTENRNYDLGKNDRNFLKDFLPRAEQLMVKFSHCSILHIGVGSGIEIETVVSNITRLGKREIGNYAIVDISRILLAKAREQLVSSLKRYNKEMNVDKIISTHCEDVAESNWSYDRPNRHPLVVILVANGYLFSQMSLLKNIYCLMEDGDYLLITTEINSSDNKIEKSSYRIEPVLNLLNISLNPLGINVPNDPKNEYYRFDFLPSKTTEYEKDFYEGYFSLQTWRHNNKEFDPADFSVIEEAEKLANLLNNRNEIKIFQSYKPSDRISIESYLEAISRDKDYVLEIVNSEEVFGEGGNSNNFTVNSYNQVGFVIQKKTRKDATTASETSD